MKNLIYFICAIVSLAYLACIGYAGLSASVSAIPTIEIIDKIAVMWVDGTIAITFWACIPLLVMAVLAFFNFFGKNLKIIFFIITILVIALDIVVLFFPTWLSGIGAGA